MKPTDLRGESPPIARASARQWLGLAVLVLPCVLVSMDGSVLFYALPSLTSALHPTGTQLLWILDIYGFVLAGLLVTMGTLGDRYGRRKILLAGAALFGGASVLAAYAPSAETLILARALLGVAGATLAPSTLSLIRTMFTDSRQRQFAIGIWTVGFTGGAVLGPIAGGFLLESFWWGSVFLVNVPVMVLLLVSGPILLPEFRKPAGGSFDLAGAVLSLAAVLPLIYAIKAIAEAGFSWASAGIGAIGLVFGALFVRRQLTARHPMVDLRLFRRAAFSGAVLTCAVTFLLLSGSVMFAAQYLQLVLGFRPLEAALWNLPGMAGMVVGIAVATAIADRIRPALAVGAGLLVAALGFALFAQVDARQGLVWLICSQVVLAVGIAAVSALATGMVLSAAPADRAGAASAVSETANEFGASVGIAVLGSLGVAIYRGHLDTVTPPVEAAARETMAAALEVAAKMPGMAGEALVAAAREAFVAGIQWVAWTGTAGSVLIACLAFLALRRRK